MREIPREAVVEAVKALCIEANRMLPADLKERLCGACRAEESPLGREVLSDIVRNYETAEALSIPVCQDTGMAVVFAELGEDAHVPGLEEAVNEGVRRGYTEGLLRCSVVGDRCAGKTPATTPPPCCTCGWCRGTGSPSPSRPRGRAART